MYKTIHDSPRITINDAAEKHPNNYILFRQDTPDMLDPTGIVLCVGDDFDELFALQMGLPGSMHVVVEGINISSKLTLGDLVAYG